jgi:hypothetical protein
MHAYVCLFLVNENLIAYADCSFCSSGEEAKSMMMG